MNDLNEGGRSFSFGVFELDAQARELRQRGNRVKLQEKPFQILELLLEKAGEVVTRKELRERLWPDTFVGFDRSLNTAVNSLRRALADSPANPRFIETRSRHGYRFIAPAEVTGWNGNHASQGADALDSIAILPFRNVSGDPELEYLSDGITEGLIDTLSQLPGVRVMARSTVFRYKAQEVDPQTVAHRLRVRALVTGWVIQHGEVLTVGAELVDAERGWRIWGEQYKRRLSDIVAFQHEISREISDNLRPHLTSEARRRLAKRPTTNPEAWLNYFRGRYFWNKMTPEGLNKAVDYFEQAIEQDPGFALPLAELSDILLLFAFFGIQSSTEVVPRAEQAVRKALDLDPGLAEAHSSLAGILKSYHWDWTSAENEYKQALELNPNYATAHRWYADFLASLGKTDDALREMERALELDPLSLIIHTEMAWIFYLARDYARALDQALQTLEMEPRFFSAHHMLGLAYEQMGKLKEAIRAFQKTQSGAPGNPVSLAALGHAYARAGQSKEARKILRQLKDQAQHSYVSPYAFAILHAGLEEKFQILEWLQRAWKERDVWLVWIQRDPRLDGVREEPQFQELCRKVGLLPENLVCA